MSLNKQQICHYLIKNKVNYAIDSTNQLPIYQRNIIRKELDNLSKETKKSFEKEIKEKNLELKIVKRLVKITAKKLIIFRSALKLDKTNNYSSEVYLRSLIVHW